MVSGKMSVVFSENGRMKKNREILENTAEREAWGALIGSKLNLPSMSLSVAQLIIDFGLHSSGIIHTHTHTHTHILLVKEGMLWLWLEFGNSILANGVHISLGSYCLEPTVDGMWVRERERKRTNIVWCLIYVCMCAWPDQEIVLDRQW